MSGRRAPRTDGPLCENVWCVWFCEEPSHVCVTGLSACEYCRLATRVRSHASVIARTFAIDWAYIGKGSVPAAAAPASVGGAHDAAAMAALCIWARFWFQTAWRFWICSRSSVHRRAWSAVRSALSCAATFWRMNVVLSGPFEADGMADAAADGKSALSAIDGSV